MAETDDSNEAFVRLLAKHDPTIRSYIRASIPNSSDLAEVMQQVCIIAWKKFSTLDDPENAFVKWTCAIARYEILKFRRGKARDRLVLDDDIIDKLAEEGIEESSSRQHWLKALDICLAKFPESRRDLLLKAYHPDTTIKELASNMNKKPNALYQILSRLRLSLVNCIEQNKAF
ncbi:sigma-70 family RNA polymerase sigma factor [Lentisphaera profundi]|uniref:Sigma-70 family RNA polymerase sigma factor n=1 Tax=Lentisphaera profundi TaxID=1658616 RepID=A0ABY7VVE3_9BACT|nr:sigma-70 family RNA polymerase sigma factor [Lentisphaera profundi]WDE97180.1 sigma-70 family RNA polymerase sigma factor [Lentisphaera profundi]